MLSRLYFAIDALFTLSILTCTTVAAGLSSTVNFEDYQNAILILSICSVILTGVKALFAFAESSQICRDVSRELDTMSNDLAKGRLNDSKVDKKITRLKKRLPAGSCLVLRY